MLCTTSRSVAAAGIASCRCERVEIRTNEWHFEVAE